MADADWEKENPYASPKSAAEGPGRPDGDGEFETFLIEPWLRPRDWIDVALGLIMAPALVLPTAAVAVALSAVPCLAAYWYLGPPWAFLIMEIGCSVFFLCGGIVLLVLVLSFAVSHLSIDVDGITFARRIGKPKSLTWKEIHVIRPATRREVFVHAWVWPGLSREPTKTMSTCGHYRIEWSDGFVFFPPKDSALFETAIRKFGPGLLASE